MSCNSEIMQKTKIKIAVIWLFLATTWSCSSREKTDREEQNEVRELIVLIFEDSLARRFFQQRKSVFKYLDDNQLPVEIAIDSKESWPTIVIETNSPFVDLVYRDNSQVEWTYYLKKGDSILIDEKHKQPWLTSISHEMDTSNMNLELIRNISLYGKPYSKAQDFYYLWSNSKLLPIQSESNEDLDQLKK